MTREVIGAEYTTPNHAQYWLVAADNNVVFVNLLGFHHIASLEDFQANYTLVTP